MTDPLQQVVWKANYSPFGNADITVDNVVNNLRFPGQYFDQETNFHYNYFRYYDPATGRYITSDPTGLFNGLLATPIRVGDESFSYSDLLELGLVSPELIHAYAYVDGNPINFFDSNGLIKTGRNDSGRSRGGRNSGGYTPSKTAQCNIYCSIVTAPICPLVAKGGALTTSPLGGAIAGGTCWVVKTLVCESECDEKLECPNPRGRNRTR